MMMNGMEKNSKCGKSVISTVVEASKHCTAVTLSLIMSLCTIGPLQLPRL